MKKILIGSLLLAVGCFGEAPKCEEIRIKREYFAKSYLDQRAYAEYVLAKKVLEDRHKEGEMKLTKSLGSVLEGQVQVLYLKFRELNATEEEKRNRKELLDLMQKEASCLKGTQGAAQ